MAVVPYKLYKELSLAEKKKLKKDFLEAGRQGNIQELQRCLNTGLDINTNLDSYTFGYTVLTAAARFDNKEAIELLTMRGAELQVTQDFVYKHRSQRGTLDKYYTPLMAAIRTASPENVQLLLQHKADVNFKKDSPAVLGETALGMAINGFYYSSDPKDKKKIELLLEHRADCLALLPLYSTNSTIGPLLSKYANGECSKAPKAS